MFPRRYELRQFQEDWDHRAESEVQQGSLGNGEEKPEPVPHSEALTSPLERAEPLASARQLSYLFVKDPKRLESQDQQVLAFLQQEKELELAYQMTRPLFQLMKNKQSDETAAWTSICSSCGISELETFALGLQKELPAFQAACSLPYNNGMAEGFVNKLKHIKGSMYGRGSFPLLRQRVLLSVSSEVA